MVRTERAATQAEKEHEAANQAYVDAYEEGASDGELKALWDAAETAREKAIQARNAANAAKRAHEGTGTTETERTSGDDYDYNRAPTTETIRRNAAKAGGRTTPQDPSDHDKEMQAAAAKIQHANAVGQQSVIRTTGEEAGGGNETEGVLPEKENPITDPYGPEGGTATPGGSIYE
jgi:hypothetical protein